MPKFTRYYRFKSFKLANMLTNYWKIVDSHPDLVDPVDASKDVVTTDALRSAWCGIPSLFA